MILDAKQIQIKERLDVLKDSLEKAKSPHFLRKFFEKERKIKSLYIHGDVGRGKSMLMRGFFNSLKNVTKIEFHFNAFMQLIHENLYALRQEEKNYPDELIEALNRVVKNNKVICFDEFQVTDIADAMLLSRIFSHLFANNIVVVFTSNAQPLNLYKDGLQREVFLSFVNQVLLTNAEVLCLDSEIDYRSQYRQSLSQRYFIHNKQNNDEIAEIIKKITDEKPLKPLKIKVWGREICFKKAHNKILVVNFDEICQNNHAASDFRAICKKVNLIFLLQIPKLSPEDVNEAKRLMLFIDEVYENKVALIVSAQTQPNEIYPEGIGHKAFSRTVSRLNEIKSDHYWQMSKIHLN